jgi:ATPase subunit of ABC transporter with duplicated ATPase domains
MITVRKLSLRRGARLVLQGAEFTLNPGEKASLVGRNGAGKSSLFSLLAGRLHADAGDVEIPPRWQIGEVAQAMPETVDGATEFVLQVTCPCSARRRPWRRPKRPTTAMRWPKRIWRWTKPVPSMRGRAPRRCCSAWVSRSNNWTCR